MGEIKQDDVVRSISIAPRWADLLNILRRGADPAQQAVIGEFHRLARIADGDDPDHEIVRTTKTAASDPGQAAADAIDAVRFHGIPDTATIKWVDTVDEAVSAIRGAAPLGGAIFTVTDTEIAKASSDYHDDNGLVAVLRADSMGLAEEMTEAIYAAIAGWA